MTKLTKAEVEKVYAGWFANIQVFVEELFPHYLSHKSPPFHQDIYNLVRSHQRLILAAPRGFAKSMICSVFYPLWAALMDEKKDICIISASEGLATEWLRKMRREIETNEYLREFFGDLKSAKWTENHIILANNNKTNIRARGAGGQIRGFRPDCIILDDIETDESVASADQRAKLRDWIFKACLNTLLPHGQFLWIGTIISPLALLQENLDANNNWKKRKFRAYIGEHKKGQELWKDLWTHERLQERKKEIGSFAFASEYLNDPICNENAVIQQHHIRVWDKVPETCNAVIAVDPAYSDDERADYKTASLVNIDNLHNRYLETYIRTHRPSGEFIDAILNLYLQHRNKITAVGIPNSGTEKEFFRSVQRRAEERKIYPPFVELKNQFTTAGGKTLRRKHDRITAALQPLFEAGKYFIGGNHEEAKDELLSIGYSRHDDLVDTLAYAESIITPQYIEPKTQERGRYGELEAADKLIIRGDYGY